MDKKKLGILIGVGGPAKGDAPMDKPEMDEGGSEDMDYDMHIESGLKDLFDCMKSGDMKGAVEAFEAAVQACSMKPQPPASPEMPPEQE